MLKVVNSFQLPIVIQSWIQYNVCYIIRINDFVLAAKFTFMSVSKFIFFAFVVLLEHPGFCRFKEKLANLDIKKIVQFSKYFVMAELFLYDRVNALPERGQYRHTGVGSLLL